jgi:hypothetical protein
MIMITTQTVLNQLTGNEIYDSLIQLMTESFSDFAECQKKYEETMQVLVLQLGDNAIDSVRNAILKQTVSNLLFSGVLGIKANFDNFVNPLTRNFLDVDFEIYLRENTARNLPDYVQAQYELDQFYAQLSLEQRTLYEDIVAFISYLESIGPKLAHYYGYLLGNELLPHIVPGYHSDSALTARYHMLLRDYWGINTFLIL